MKLSITDEYFEDMADKFDEMLTKTLDEMRTKGSNDAQITLKLGIELLPSTAATYDDNGDYLEERESTIPKFTYKITSAVSYPKGKLEGNIHDYDNEILPDGRGGYRIQQRPKMQTRMW